MKNTLKYGQTISVNRSKRLPLIGWILVWGVALYFIYTNALRYFNPSYEIYTPAFRPYAPFIVLHVAGGMIALLIGPLQFFATIRIKYVRLHRMIGKVYLSSILVSGVSAVYLSVFDSLIRNGNFMFGTGTLGMALAWFITGGMAYWAIRVKNIPQHREWMIRNYVLTANFIIFRLIYYGLLGLENFPFRKDVGGFTAWASWALPLLITEFILQARKIRLGKS